MTEYLTLSASVQGLLCSGFALCTLGMLLLSLPNAHRFFATERSKGYADDEPFLSALLSPFGRMLVLLSWFAAGCWLLADQHTVLAAFVCLLWSRVFFISLRWRSISRGMGAPGFMLYWLAALIFFLEWTRFYDPAGWLRPLVILTFKVDFAVIMICAGQYKLFAGYPQNNGMERGMVNPWWGRLWKFYRKFPPRSVVFRFFNHCAYLTEIVAGLLMLFPPTAEIGALAMAASFIFIFIHIRLGFLCHTVMVCCFLFCVPGGLVDRFLPQTTELTEVSAGILPLALNYGMAVFLICYLVLLPFMKAGQYYNFYAKKKLPQAWQSFQDRWTNLMGIIIWRVFTIDNTNFYVHAYFENRETGERKLYSKPGEYDLASGLRYIHVCEFVCFVSIFTTVKYFPSNSPLFQKKLWRYAKTIPCPPDSVLVFQWVDIKKHDDHFEDVPSREFRCDLRAEEITVVDLEDGSSVTDNLRYSDLHEGSTVGSYAPK